MKSKFKDSDIATLTGRAIQDNETFKSEGGFIPERDQYYFELKKDDNKFLVGFKDLLLCLRLLESIEEIPQIEESWWNKMALLYGDEIFMIKYNMKKHFLLTIKILKQSMREQLVIILTIYKTLMEKKNI